MPYNNPGTQEDPYSDGAPDAAPEAKEGSEQSEGNVATLPVDICPGMKPGEELVLHIDAVHEKEYVVSYAPEKGQEGEGGMEKAEMPSGDSGMSSMYE